jgi:hypothetical protein
MECLTGCSDYKKIFDVLEHISDREASKIIVRTAEIRYKDLTDITRKKVPTRNTVLTYFEDNNKFLIDLSNTPSMDLAHSFGISYR